MKTLSPVSLARIALLAVALSGIRAAAAEKRFDPARTFPLECLAYVQVPSGRELLRALADTLPGRVASDPEVLRAMGRLPEVARGIIHAISGPIVEASGRDPLGLLSLLGNEVAISVTGLDPFGKVGVVAGVELGKESEAIREVLGRVTAYVARATGKEPARVDLAGEKAVVWLFPGAPFPVYHVVLGTHLVVANSPGVLQSVIESFKDESAAADFTLSANQRYAEARGKLALESPRLFFFLNLESLRGLFWPFLQRNAEAKEVLNLLQAAGVPSLNSLGYSLGSRGGDVEGKLLLGMAPGGRGLLPGLVESIAKPSDIAGALAAVPARAMLAGAWSWNGGQAFRAIDRFCRDGLPASASQTVAGWAGTLLERTGLTLDGDLFSLGRLDAVVFAAVPPAGGLMEDWLLLVRTDAFAPYLRVAEKVAKALGKEARELPAAGTPTPGTTGKRVRYLLIGPVLSRLLGDPAAFPLPAFTLTMLEPAFSLAWCELDGGLTVVAQAPQAVLRYLAARSLGGKELGVAAELRAQFPAGGDAGAYVSFRPNTTFLAAYNTIAGLAATLGGAGRPYLDAYQADLALLPPGEKFLDKASEGFLRLDASGGSLVIHGHRVFSSSAGLWVLLGTAAAISAGVPMGVFGE